MKKLVWIIIGIVIIAAFYLLLRKKTDIPTIPQEFARATYAWKFNQKPERDGMPQTEIVLLVNSGEHVIGTFDGSCKEIPEGATGILSEPADKNEVSRVQCWAGGGGNEVGVFQEGEDFIVKSGLLDEGTAETPAFRGNFVPILAL